MPIVDVLGATIEFPDEILPDEVRQILGNAFSDFAGDLDTATNHLSRLAEGSVIVGMVRNMRPEDRAALGTSMIPVVGDALGAYADYTDIKENWDDVPWLSKVAMGGAALIGAIPILPSRAQIHAGVNTLLHRGDHAAPTRTGEYAPLHEMNKTYPDDIYDKSTQVRYYGDGSGDSWEQESFDVINAARGNPDMEIEVYRAVPNSAPDVVYAGDWVTPSKTYAQSHGERFGDDGGKVLTTKVRAGDLFTEGNSPHEFGWSPSQTFDPTTADISHLSRSDQFRYESAINNENWERAAELARKPTLVARQKITAYHGSPHDFDKFQSSQIGTGEGVQAYGDGLYFAESEDVARGYKASTNYADKKRQFLSELPENAEIDDVMDAMDSGKFSPQMREMVAALQDNDWLGFDYPSQAISAAFSKNIDSYDASERLLKARDNGSMYEVNIDVEPDELIDWDIPINQQSKKVQDAVYANRDAVDQRIVDDYFGGDRNDIINDEMTGQQYMSNMDKVNAGMIDGTEYELAERGIKGVRYADGFSRGAEGGTSNYVIFDENLITIARKYGIAIPAAAAILARETGQNPATLYEEET